MRTTLLNWLVQVHAQFRLLPETLHLTANIIDRFLSLKPVSLEKLQLAGIASLFIACKFEEIVVPGVDHLVYMVAGSSSPADILAAERFVLGILKYDLGAPSPHQFMRRIAKADGFDVRPRVLAKYLMEVMLLDERFLPWPASKVAAVATFVARKAISQADWTPAHVELSGYMEAEILPGAYMLIDSVATRAPGTFVYEKYCQAKFMYAAWYMGEYIKRGGG
ncbi:cyclin-like protein [Blyttiomyces helicus]|uniref:Cyclin-like protein n=1 Tax=Blyttiomyces helicus TaxID=388810 RepID=A0A4P9WN48_9FUNG|nr:cyclin-like protein [Blyttiomyces helicus]|eukprot:RKO93675.1 cyclin-like protein [Blyttiomyces helicus]